MIRIRDEVKTSVNETLSLILSDSVCFRIWPSLIHVVKTKNENSQDQNQEVCYQYQDKTKTRAPD